MEVRFPDLYKNKSKDTQLLQDQVFLQVHNIIEEGLYEPWKLSHIYCQEVRQHVYDGFHGCKDDQITLISGATKTLFRQCLNQRRMNVSTDIGLDILATYRTRNADRCMWNDHATTPSIALGAPLNEIK